MALDKEALDSLRIDRTTHTSRKKNRGRWIIVALILIIVAIALFAMKGSSSRPVKTATVQQRSAGEIRVVLNASGYVTARRQATVSSKVTGKVVDVLVEEGMEVNEGQVLAKLDASNAQAALALAEAQLAAAQSALDEIAIRSAEAQEQFQRIQRLATDKVASLADLDQAEAESQSLQARLELQRREVSVAERQLDLSQQQLDDTVIRAPFAGIVISKNAQPGEMISPMSAGGGFTRTGICTIVDMQSLEIEVDVNEAYINRVTTGQTVEARLNAHPDWAIPAKVIAIVPAADRQKATVKVRIAFNELDPRILPDMGVKVSFLSETSPAEQALAIVPLNALTRRDNQDVVFVNVNGAAQIRPVAVAEFGTDDAVIQEGVKPGDIIVLNPGKELRDGDAVHAAQP